MSMGLRKDTTGKFSKVRLSADVIWRIHCSALLRQGAWVGGQPIFLRRGSPSANPDPNPNSAAREKEKKIVTAPSQSPCWAAAPLPTATDQSEEQPRPAIPQLGPTSEFLVDASVLCIFSPATAPAPALPLHPPRCAAPNHELAASQQPIRLRDITRQATHAGADCFTVYLRGPHGLRARAEPSART